MSFWKKITTRGAKALEHDLADNPLDKVIVEKGTDVPEVDKVYQARWVWYHTILAGLMAIMVVELLVVITLVGIIAFKI